MSQETTATQIGAVCENLVANELILASEGRLSPFRPVADDGGIDLLVFDKETGKALPLQVKSRTKTLRRSPNVVHFQVRLATFRENRSGFLLAAYVDLHPVLRVKRAWLVPLADLPEVAATRTDKLVIRPSVADRSKDRYAEYRYDNLGEVTERIIKALEAES